MTMKKFFIVALCVAGMMSSCSNIDDNIANDAKSSILLTQQEYASIVPDSQLEMTQGEIVDMVSKFSTWSGSEDGYYMVDRNTTNLNFETSYNGHYNQDLKLYPNVRKK